MRRSSMRRRITKMNEEFNKDVLKSVMEADKMVREAKDGKERTRMEFEKLLRSIYLTAGNYGFSAGKPTISMVG